MQMKKKIVDIIFKKNTYYYFNWTDELLMF